MTTGRINQVAILCRGRARRSRPDSTSSDFGTGARTLSFERLGGPRVFPTASSGGGGARSSPNTTPHSHGGYPRLARGGRRSGFVPRAPVEAGGNQPYATYLPRPISGLHRSLAFRTDCSPRPAIRPQRTPARTRGHELVRISGRPRGAGRLRACSRGQRPLPLPHTPPSALLTPPFHLRCELP